MHALRRADDRIDGAGVDAKRAAYAAALVDDRDTRRPVRAAARVQRGGSLTRQRGEQDDRGVASRGAAIDRCRAARYGFSVGTTPLESAARALRLRQCGIDTLDQGFHDPIVIDENASGGSAKYASGGPGMTKGAVTRCPWRTRRAKARAESRAFRRKETLSALRTRLHRQPEEFGGGRLALEVHQPVARFVGARIDGPGEYDDVQLGREPALGSADDRLRVADLAGGDRMRRLRALWPSRRRSRACHRPGFALAARPQRERERRLRVHRPTVATREAQHLDAHVVTAIRVAVYDGVVRHECLRRVPCAGRGRSAGHLAPGLPADAAGW